MRTKAIALLLLLAVAAMCSAEETPKPKPAQITVNVLGAVNKPSRVTLSKGATILDALASAGGETTAGDVVLRDGDTINVLKALYKKD